MLTATPDLVAPELSINRSGLAAAAVLHDFAVPPTAIFAAADNIAAAAVLISLRRGLDIPGDLTVCGCDDTALATSIWSELTTMRQPVFEISQMAVEMLVSTIR